MPTVLSEQQIKTKLKKLKGWKLVTGEIKKTFTLPDFVHAMGFVNQVALLAEKANHHPDIDIRWNNITLTLCTHSAGG
ncbi:MAG: 4a-hydroxytetrahydrobiopterin dehydratase, partial [Bacteroidetes bacterium]